MDGIPAGERRGGRDGSALEPATDAESAEQGTGRVIAVAGAKGGIGRTAIANNLAVSLADNQSGSVALIDFDLEFGDVALAMDLVPDFSLVDLPSQMGRLDPLLLGQYMTLHRSGSGCWRRRCVRARSGGSPPVMRWPY